MKKFTTFLKKILILRRIKDGLFAIRYFNKKYLQIIKWMFNSKEDTNFTYDLEDKNLNELYKLLESVFDKNFSDSKIMFSRRIGWYIIARILKPKIIVETGLDKGLGSVILAEALIKNKSEGFFDKYYGTDINLNAGYLF